MPCVEIVDVVGVHDDQWNMLWVGYVIIGRGEESDMIVTNVPGSILQLEDIVIENCQTISGAQLQTIQMERDVGGAGMPNRLAPDDRGCVNVLRSPARQPRAGVHASAADQETGAAGFGGVWYLA